MRSPPPPPEAAPAAVPSRAPTAPALTPTLHHPLPAAASPPGTPPAAAPERHRRLWELPTQAHELLLALSFAPDTLRRHAERALGRVHRGVCQLQGSEVDVLYSLVHDMGVRNPLSEALHKRLDERHALAVRRLAVLRDADALQAAWQQALQGEEMPATLWALLTHPLGTTLQGPVLYAARGWVFARSRQGAQQAQLQARLQGDLASAQAQLQTLQRRLATAQQQAAVDRAQAQADLAQARGEALRWRLACEQQPAPAEGPRTPDRPAAAAPANRAPETPGAAPPRRPSPDGDRGPAACAAASPVMPAAGAASGQPLAMHGRRVLCVGGMQHAVARYRARIEGLGAHFEHHDGGLQNSVHALDGRLNRAELVICQAACINHEAYHRIKRHCDRTGTPCVYLERPSLSRFDRALQDLERRPAQIAEARHAR